MQEEKEVEKKFNANAEIEIDLRRVVDAVLKKVWAVVLATLIAAGAAYGVSTQLITPMYKSKAMFYVNNQNISIGDSKLTMSTGDLSVSRGLVDTYLVVLNARSTIMEVIDYAGVDLSYAQVKGMISASAVNDTEIFEVVVTNADPVEADIIADAITYILPKKISSIIEGTSAKIVDTSIVAAAPSSPNVFKNTALGGILGMMASVGIIALMEIFNTTIRTEEDIESVSSYPILVGVPDMIAGGKSKGSYYADGRKRRKRRGSNDESDLIGGEVSFTASEAYKMLRTKIQFSFADEKNCYVIGLSSALAGEGKSVTAINLAYSLAQLGKKVLLIDCDMRKPTVCSKLKLKNAPGLSNYLTRQNQNENILQIYADKANHAEFDVIAAGNTPPNPVELISSSRMVAAIEKFREEYEYVILDLPPIGEVTDAMAASKHTDGILLVSRMNFGDRYMLGDAIEQFDFIGAKILGIVATCVSEDSKGYGYRYRKGYGYRRGYYRRYYGTKNRYYSDGNK